MDIDFWNERMRGWRLALPPESLLYKDLDLFCRARETVARDNPYLMYLLEGRRQVFLRIQQHQDLPLEKLQELYPTLEIYYG
jgi:hypothetical protein